jgi:hypothetical protein
MGDIKNEKSKDTAKIEQKTQNGDKQNENTQHRTLYK